MVPGLNHASSVFCCLDMQAGGVWLSKHCFFSDDVGCSSRELFEAPKQGVGNAKSEMLGLGAGAMARVDLRCGEEFEGGIFARTILSKAKPPSRGTALKVSRPSWRSGICPSQGGCSEFTSIGAHKTTEKTYQLMVLGKGSVTIFL